MAYFRAGGGGIPASLKSGMNSVLNKKFGTVSQDYPPADWPDDVNLLGPLPIIISNKAPIVSFNDGADDVPISEGTFYIAPSQSGTGTPSPSNPRPIVGYTGLKIIQLGKNILNINASIEEPNPTSLNVSPRILEDFKWYKGLRSDNYYYPNYITYSVGSGSITVTNSNNSNAYGMSYCFPIRPGEVFTVSLVCDSSPLFSVGYFDKNWNFVGTSSSSYQVTSQTITAPSEAYHAILTLRAPQNTPRTYSSVQIEFGSTAHAYEQYQTPTQYTASLGRTIYGGERKTDGSLTETHIVKTVRWGDLTNVTQLADVTRKEIALSASEEPKYTMAQASTDLMCNIIGTYDMTYSGNFEHMYIANTSRIWVYLPNGTDADTQLSVCYTLATPNEYSLSPISLSTYYGDNNVWCDTGDSQLNYRADISLYINNH